MMTVPAFVIMAAQHAAGVTPTGMLDEETLAALRDYDEEHGPFRRTNTAEHLAVSVAQHASGLTSARIDGIYGNEARQAVEAYQNRNGMGTEPPRAAESPVMASKTAPDATAAAMMFQKDGLDLLDSTTITPEGGLASIPNRKNLKQVYW